MNFVCLKPFYPGRHTFWKVKVGTYPAYPVSDAWNAGGVIIQLNSVIHVSISQKEIEDHGMLTTPTQSRRTLWDRLDD